MDNNDNIFSEDIVEQTKTAEKPKRKLSEKQLAALAKGRKRMAEKRKDFKKNNKQKNIEENNLVEKNNVVQKQQKETKKKLIEEQNEEQEHYLKLLENRKKLHATKNDIDNWKKLRSKYLKKTETIEDFETLKTELDTITEEDIKDKKLLKNKLSYIVNKYK